MRLHVGFSLNIDGMVGSVLDAKDARCKVISIDKSKVCCISNSSACGECSKLGKMI